MLVIREW